MESSVGEMSLLLEDYNLLKAFSRVITCAARIGENFSVCCSPDNLVLVSMTSSKFQSSEFTFSAEYFESYYSRGRRANAKVQFVLNAKLVLSVRTLRMSKKRADTHLTVDIVTRALLHKTFHVPFLDDEVRQSELTPDYFSCNAKARPKLLLDIFTNFQGRSEELTLAFASNRMRTISSSEDDTTKSTATLRTEMVTDAQEFDEYFVPKTGELALTFNQRAYRAVLELGEAFNAPLNMYFGRVDEPLQQLLFTVTLPAAPDKSLVGVFTLATLSPSEASGVTSGNVVVTATPTSAVRTDVTERPAGESASASTRRDRATNASTASTRTRADESTSNRHVDSRNRHDDADDGDDHLGRAQEDPQAHQDREDGEDDDEEDDGEYVAGTPPPQ